MDVPKAWRAIVLVCALETGALGACALGSASARAETPVDLELVLAVDSSGSVDAGEFDLQVRGIAGALRDPEVIEALAGFAPRGVAVALVQWSGRAQQLVAIDWTHVGDEASAHALAGRIEAMPRLTIGETALAEALGFAIGMLDGNGFAGARRTIDLSGDGPTNARLAPDVMRDAAAAAGITINGLAILNEAPALDLYYQWHVIGGPGAFVIVARDYADVAQAMRRKLLREIRGGPLAAVPPTHVFASINRN